MSAASDALAVAPADHHIIDLFAGPGGLDVAASWCGIPSTGVEWDKGACATRKAALIDTRNNDVRELSEAGFRHADILAAGPPCQTFTVAGSGAGRRALDLVLSLVKRMSAGEDVSRDLGELSDERTGLVLEPLRWALDAYRSDHPFQTIILEQVPAVLPVWEAYEEALDGLGYKTTTKVLRTEEYGVPQTRKRAILIASLNIQPILPKPTHQSFSRSGKGPTESRGLPWKSIADALSLLPGGDRTYPFEVVSNYGSGGDPKARGRRLSTEPSATVTGKVTRNRIVDHLGVHRDRLSHSESGLLQTFPHDFPWSGTDIGQQIGNAIPPRLGAQVIAAALGFAIDPKALDNVVALPWTQSHGALATKPEPVTPR